MFTIYKKFDFAYAHQIDGHEKCGLLHGHNALVECWITSDTLSKPYNFVFDFGKFKDIQKKYDHTGTIFKMSSELMANEIHDTIKEQLQDLTATVKVRIWESDHSYAEYSGS